MNPIAFRLSIFSLLCASCATPQDSLLRIEFEERAKDLVKPQSVCAERKVKSVDDCVSNTQSVALELSMRCRREYEKTTKNYAQAFFDNEEEREVFREKRNNIQERTEAFLPFVIDNRIRADSLCPSLLRK